LFWAFGDDKRLIFGTKEYKPINYVDTFPKRNIASVSATSDEGYDLSFVSLFSKPIANQIRRQYKAHM